MVVVVCGHVVGLEFHIMPSCHKTSFAASGAKKIRPDSTFYF